MKPYKNAVIFAGGKSSRMGEDKALLPFGTYNTLSHFQFEKLKKLFSHVYLSAKKDKFDFDAPVITDRDPQDSPMVGLLSVFETLDVEEVFILSVDAPFVDAAIIDKLMERQKEPYDAIVAKSPSGIQPLCGRYRSTILPFIKKQLQADNHRLSNLLTLAHTHFVTFEEDNPFTNLNHRTEYEKAMRQEADKRT